MGIAGAGNSGTAVAALFAPRLATHYGWQHVYGFAAAMMLFPLCVMIFLAKEPPDIEHQSLRQHLSCLFEKDGWYFNLIYIITFGGFIGLATFLPSFYYAQFHVTKIMAGELTVLATLTGSATRVLGGWFSDRVGGITTLSVVFLITIAGLFGLMTAPAAVRNHSAFYALLRGPGRRQWCYLPAGTNPLAAYDRGGGWHDRGDWRARWIDPAEPLSALQAIHCVLSSWFHSVRGAGHPRSYHAPRCSEELDDDLGRPRRESGLSRVLRWNRWLQTKRGEGKDVDCSAKWHLCQNFQRGRAQT